MKLTDKNKEDLLDKERSDRIDKAFSHLINTPENLEKDADAVLILSKFNDDLVKDLEPKGTFFINVNDKEISKLFHKYGSGFLKLCRQTLEYALTKHHQGVFVSHLFKEMRIKLIDDVDVKLRMIAPKHEGVPVTFNCMVMAVGPRKSYIKKGVFKCPTCEDAETLKCDDTRKIRIPRCGRRACRGARYEIQPNDLETGYIQTVIIQELMEEVENNTPVMFTAKLVDFDVGEAYMSQKKKITGVFRTVVTDPKKNEFDINIDVIGMENLDDITPLKPTDKQLEKFKEDSKGKDFMDKLGKSFAPHIFGHDMIKQSLILTMVGGTKQPNIRHWINTFLIGDPSTAKTELLKFAQVISPKAIYTTGKGSTAAGLTAGMVKQSDGTSMCMAGVYPLCHLGLAAIDEFDKMDKSDYSVMHETMEHGTVSKTVSGIVVTLPAQTTTLAAANPKFGRYDPDMTVRENIDLPEPILTRMDMIWLILDKVDMVLDTKKAQHILNTFRHKTRERKTYLTAKQLMSFINHVKGLEPELSDEVERYLIEFYNELRENSAKDKDNTISIYTRHLQALTRLTLAHAKVHFKKICDKSDVDAVFDMYREMFKSFGKDMDKGFTQMDIFGDKKLDIEQQFRECWRKVADDNGSVASTDLCKCLSEVHKWEQKMFDRYWYEVQYKKKLILHAGGGRWKWGDQ